MTEISQCIPTPIASSTIRPSRKTTHTPPAIQLEDITLPSTTLGTKATPCQAYKRRRFSKNLTKHFSC